MKRRQRTTAAAKAIRNLDRQQQQRTENTLRRTTRASWIFRWILLYCVAFTGVVLRCNLRFASKRFSTSSRSKTSWSLARR